MRAGRLAATALALISAMVQPAAASDRIDWKAAVAVAVGQGADGYFTIKGVQSGRCVEKMLLGMQGTTKQVVVTKAAVAATVVTLMYVLGRTTHQAKALNRIGWIVGAEGGAFGAWAYYTCR